MVRPKAAAKPAKGEMTTAIDRPSVANGVRGMGTADASAWLSKNLSMRRDPLIEIRSDVLNMGRLPFFAFRVQVEVAP